jgi:hypothetical protein
MPDPAQGKLQKTFGKTFGKRSRPVVVHGDDPAELRQLPPPAPVSKGPAVRGTGRLGRQDLGIACSLMDDLQYALDGLASASLPVRRRSAVKVLAICLDPKAAAARITLSAALVVSAIREVRSSDALLSLAFAAVLRTIALDEICSDDVLQDLVLCGLERLQPAAEGAAATSGEPDAAPALYEPVWVHVRAVCSSPAAPLPRVAAEAAAAATLGGGTAPLPVARALLVAAMSAAVERSPRAREALCAQGGVPALLGMLAPFAAGRADAMGLAASCDLDMLLGLLQAATFVPAGGKASFAAPATHARGDAPVATAAAGAAVAVAAAGAAGTSVPKAPPSSVAASDLGPLLRLLAVVARYQHGARHPSAPPRARASPRPAARGGEASGVGKTSRRGAAASSPAATSASGGKEAADPFGFDLAEADETPQPVKRGRGATAANRGRGRGGREEGAACAAAGDAKPVAATAAPCGGGEAEEAEAEEGGWRRLLIQLLRALVNLTNGQRQACEQLLREGLPSIVTVLSREFEGCEVRGGLPRHFDTCLMSLGLLANCLELGDERVRLTVAAALVPPTVPGGTLLPLLANVLRALLQPVGTKDEAAPADEQRAMERQVSAAYVALVVGFLCRDAADLCATALAELGEPTFERAAQILQSFLELHSSAQLLSAEGAEAMAAVVEWMRNYAP